MLNIKVEIHKHNKNTLEKAQQKHPDTQLCNCTNKMQCLLNGQCLTESTVYQANVMANFPGYKENVYLGVSETTFKVCYCNHKKSLTKQRHKNDTELSKEYWKVKQQNGIPRIKWKVLRKCHAYNQKKRQCILCLNEKYEIACYKGDILLNKRTEILGTCRHRNKYSLKVATQKTNVIFQSHIVITDTITLT